VWIYIRERNQVTEISRQKLLRPLVISQRTLPKKRRQIRQQQDGRDQAETTRRAHMLLGLPQRRHPTKNAFAGSNNSRRTGKCIWIARKHRIAPAAPQG
jgi:hypothetical protein